MQQETVGFGD